MYIYIYIVSYRVVSYCTILYYIIVSCRIVHSESVGRLPNLFHYALSFVLPCHVDVDMRVHEYIYIYI